MKKKKERKKAWNPNHPQLKLPEIKMQNKQTTCKKERDKNEKTIVMI